MEISIYRNYGDLKNEMEILKKIINKITKLQGKGCWEYKMNIEILDNSIEIKMEKGFILQKERKKIEVKVTYDFEENFLGLYVDGIFKEELEDLNQGIEKIFKILNNF